MSVLATGIRSVYEPIVRLADRRTIAYEALARGPAGSPLERPDVLFATARREGLETALDWECRRAALRGALAGGLNPELALFVNVEPSSATSWVPEIGDPLLEEALGRFPLVVEVTERALANHATDLIPLAEDLRRRGARIALDDVGTDPRSLALMPFLRPDVIKLDLKLMHNSPSREIAEVAHRTTSLLFF
jgi:EAL domain-containing protein (putative c-di-GMP-specific phosphodiesterase class I)